MSGLIDTLKGLLGAAPAARRVAKALGRRMDSSPKTAGQGWRLRGAWGAARCQVTLGAAPDTMRAEVPCAHAGRFELSYAMETDGDRVFVSERVAASPDDARTLEALPLSLRLHAIEVTEAGRGSLRLEGGTLRLHVPAAHLDRADATTEVGIRLDVLVELAAALPKALP